MYRLYRQATYRINALSTTFFRGEPWMILGLQPDNHGICVSSHQRVKWGEQNGPSRMDTDQIQIHSTPL